MEGTGRDSVTPLSLFWKPALVANRLIYGLLSPALWPGQGTGIGRNFALWQTRPGKVSSGIATRKGWKSRTNLYFIHFPFPSCSQIWLKAYSEWKAAAQGWCRAIVFLSLGGFPSLYVGFYGAQFIISIFYKHQARKMPVRWLWLFCNHCVLFVHCSSA